MESNFVKKNVKKKLKTACFFPKNHTGFIYNNFKKNKKLKKYNMLKNSLLNMKYVKWMLLKGLVDIN
jgi:hypothetical protein